MSMEETKFTRRSFLKGAGALGAAAALGGSLAYKPVEAFAEAADVASNTGEKEAIFGYCHMCMSNGNCSYVGTVKDGVVVNLEGDPRRKSSKGMMCPRGKSAILQLYNPHRITAPMKRTNPEKGMEVDPGWVEISWDEALDLAAEKIKEAVDEDPRKLVNMFGFASYESGHATMGLGLWPGALGSPNTSSTKGQMCAIHYGGCYAFSCFPTICYDGKYNNYLVILGRGMGYDNASANSDALQFAENLKRGARYVVVGPRCTMEASRGEWVPSKPGSDLSLVYAWMHCMLYEIENGFDEPFVRSRTNAPYLIDENGDYVLGADGKPLMWDEADGTAKAFDDPALAKPALFGEHEVNGKKYPTAFTLFKESLKDFTPEWAEEYSTVPAAKIREIANNLVKEACFGRTIVIEGNEMPLRPAAVVIGRGDTNQEDGTLCDLFSRVLNMLLGNPGYPGGVIGNSYAEYKVNEGNGTIEPYMEAATVAEGQLHWPPNCLDYSDCAFPHRHSTNTLMLRSMDDPEYYGFDYKPSVLVSTGANPIITTAQPEAGIAACKAMDFVIYHGCYHYDEMAMMSDLLLPEHSVLEDNGVYFFPGNEGCANFDDEEVLPTLKSILVRKGVAPLYNTMESNDILIEIFDRMGRIKDWNETINAHGAIGYTALKDVPPSAPNPPQWVDWGNEEWKLEPEKKYTIREIWDRNIKSQYGDDKGIEYLEQEHLLEYNPLRGANVYPSFRSDQKVRFQVYLESQHRDGRRVVDFLRSVKNDHGFDIEERIKFPIDEIERRYTALPYWPEKVRALDSEPAEFDLYGFNYRQPLHLFRQGNADQDPVRRDYSDRYIPDFNSILLNTQVCEERGIQLGDEIIVESPYGKTHGKALPTDIVRPDCVGVGGTRGRCTSWMGKELVDDTSYNKIMNSDFGYCDPIDGAVIDVVRVKIYKA